MIAFAAVILGAIFRPVAAPILVTSGERISAGRIVANGALVLIGGSFTPITLPLGLTDNSVGQGNQAKADT